MKKTLLLSSAIAFCVPTLANAAGFEILAPHRATYEIKLKDAEDRSGIRSMNGRIVYELSGNACDGISVRHRFVTNIRTATELFVTDQQSTTFESPDGKEFSFTTKNFVNDQKDRSVRGNATLTDEGTKVTLTSPETQELKLDPSKFVSAHLLDVINGAKAGEQIVQTDVFDGSGDANEVVASTSIIGKKKPVAAPLEGEPKDIGKALDSVDAWPVTVSYFKKNIGNTAESLPIYEASFVLHSNGVTRDLTMRYPEYSLTATLKSLELLEQEACN